MLILPKKTKIVHVIAWGDTLDRFCSTETKRQPGALVVLFRMFWWFVSGMYGLSRLQQLDYAEFRLPQNIEQTITTVHTEPARMSGATT